MELGEVGGRPLTAGAAMEKAASVGRQGPYKRIFKSGMTTLSIPPRRVCLCPRRNLRDYSLKVIF